MKRVNLQARCLPSLILMTIVALLLPLAGCGDREIYFTSDEIVGDIITGNQIRMQIPSIVTMGSIKVNVQNAKGNVTATPSDPEMAEIVDYCYSKQRYPELYINLKKQGDVSILVKDEDGNTAALCLKVHAGGLMPDPDVEK